MNSNTLDRHEIHEKFRLGFDHIRESLTAIEVINSADIDSVSTELAMNCVLRGAYNALIEVEELLDTTTRKLSLTNFQ